MEKQADLYQAELNVDSCKDTKEAKDAPLIAAAGSSISYDVQLSNMLFSSENEINSESLKTAILKSSSIASTKTLANEKRFSSDPILQQILIDESENQANFDAEAEGLKLKQFLEGNLIANNDVEVVQHVKIGTELPSTAYRIIRCYNCGILFDILSFQNHSCDYDASHNLIELPGSIDKKGSSVHLPTAPNKHGSERIIMENQIRIRRHLKEELKYDLNVNLETFTEKKSKGPNECTMCERKFVHASGLVRHMEKHALDLIPTNMHANQTNSQMMHGLRLVLKCGDCGRIFYDIGLAQEHVETHLAVRTDFKSVNTDGGTNFIEFMAEAESTLEDVGEYRLNHVSAACIQEEKSNEVLKMTILSSVLQCEYCEYVFSDVSYLFVHSATHSPERPFECAACDIQMSTLKESLNHYQTECGYMRENLKRLQITVQRYYVCNVCESKFLTLEQLYEHRYTTYHYFPREDKSQRRLAIPCEYCDVVFTSAQDAPNHYEQKHVSKKKREKEVRSTNLTASGRIRQYLCDICGKSYTQSSHLWQHLRFHQGVKPFVCQEDGCGRKFTIRPDLNDHIRKCHTGERPYHCLVCGKRFLTGSVFYQHRLIHRGERRYECEECGKRFYRADALKNHQRIHTGEKPYSCLFCTKTFRQRGDRDKHIRARHAHLDANSRLMMQMQKFQLEAAAAAAALKAKKMQEINGQHVEPDPGIVAEMFPQSSTSASMSISEFGIPISVGTQKFLEIANLPVKAPSTVKHIDENATFASIGNGNLSIP